MKLEVGADRAKIVTRVARDIKKKKKQKKIQNNICRLQKSKCIKVSLRVFNSS